jgi:hypothetical protein
VTYDAERLAERGAALARWIALGGSVDRLCRLDRGVRHARVTDVPGRPAGPEPRQGIPDLDFAEPQPPPGSRREMRPMGNRSTDPPAGEAEDDDGRD